MSTGVIEINTCVVSTIRAIDYIKNAQPQAIYVFGIQI